MDQERDLGLLVDTVMRVSAQCEAGVKKAHSMLRSIKKGIENAIVQSDGKVTSGGLCRALVATSQQGYVICDAALKWVLLPDPANGGPSTLPQGF